MARLEPVAMHLEDDPRLPRMLEAMLVEERANLVEALAKNYAKDILDYKLRVGTIEGLDIAIAICKRAREKLES